MCGYHYIITKSDVCIIGLRCSLTIFWRYFCRIAVLLLIVKNTLWIDGWTFTVLVDCFSCNVKRELNSRFENSAWCFHNAVSLISFGLSWARNHIGLKRDTVGSHGYVCRGKYSFFSVSALAHLRGVFLRETQYLCIRYAVSLRLASVTLVVSEKNKVDSSCWHVRSDKFVFKSKCTQWGCKSMKYRGTHIVWQYC